MPEEYTDAAHFLRALKHATDNGLEHEFVLDVFHSIRRGEPVSEAIWYANCEWDL